jgi:hypothetical protein
MSYQSCTAPNGQSNCHDPNVYSDPDRTSGALNAATGTATANNALTIRTNMNSDRRVVNWLKVCFLRSFISLDYVFCTPNMSKNARQGVVLLPHVNMYVDSIGVS